MGRGRGLAAASPAGPRLGLLVVGLTAGGLRQSAADHVADGQDRRVRPHLVGANASGWFTPLRLLLLLVASPAIRMPAAQRCRRRIPSS